MKNEKNYEGFTYLLAVGHEMKKNYVGFVFQKHGKGEQNFCFWGLFAKSKFYISRDMFKSLKYDVFTIIISNFD